MYQEREIKKTKEFRISLYLLGTGSYANAVSGKN